MKKTKAIKITAAFLGVILTIILAAAAYIIFGVLGVESKRTYPESTIVNESNANLAKSDEYGITVIDDAAQYQTMDGFGASGCWWAQSVGGWENQRDILSLLYSKENGIGLNIYRYNLGAGSADDENMYVLGNRTECFLQPDGTYDFTADANAQNVLATARALAGDDLRVSLFANSAPVSLTKNGKAYSSAPESEEEELTCNLDEANYKAYADFCYTTAEHFLSQGYRVTDVSPVNEPQYAWRAWYNADGTYSMNQEGCHYSEEELTALMSVMVKRFKDTDVDAQGCKLSMFESGAIEGDHTIFSSYISHLAARDLNYAFQSMAVRRYFDTISTHSYWSSTDTKKRAAKYLATYFQNYDVACTEYCQMSNDGSTGVLDLIEESGGTNGLTIEYGVAMANVIIDDLTILNAKEWDWWLGCSFGVYTDGLVYINADDHSDIQTSKRLWCLGNFSKFIDEGAVRIACSSGVENLSSCAFKNTDGSTVIVYVNSTDTDLTTNLDNISFNSFDVYTTSAEYDLEKTFSNDGSLSTTAVSVPSQSVVTVVIK